MVISHYDRLNRLNLITLLPYSRLAGKFSVVLSHFYYSNAVPHTLECELCESQKCLIHNRHSNIVERVK